MGKFSAIASIAAILAACGGTGTGTVKSPTGGNSPGIEGADLPFRVVNAKDGREVDAASFVRELSGNTAICVGESHRNPHHHWVQLMLVDKVFDTSSGTTYALGMEMFQRPFQGVLDDFAAARIDEKTMLSRTGYQERWGYDWGFYQPIVKRAMERKATLLALNTERELTKKVSRGGLENLSPADRAKLPELVLNDPTHRAWWNAIMGAMGGAAGHSKQGDPHSSEGKDKPDHGEGHDHGTKAHGDGHGTKAHGDGHGTKAHGDGHGTKAHGDGHDKKADGHGDKKAHGHNPHGHGAPKPAKSSRGERIYAAQVLWDETMAEGAAKWLAAGTNRRIVILAGNGHCHDSAIVSRLKRRGVAATVSVRPIIDDGSNVAAELASPETDYLVIMSTEEAGATK